MKAALFVALLLVSCSTTSLQDLYTESIECVVAHEDCSEVNAQIERKEAIIMRRELDQPPKCPVNSIAYCAWWGGRGCGRSSSSMHRWVCVDKGHFGDL